MVNERRPTVCVCPLRGATGPLEGTAIMSLVLSEDSTLAVTPACVGVVTPLNGHSPIEEVETKLKLMLEVGTRYPVQGAIAGRTSGAGSDSVEDV